MDQFAKDVNAQLPVILPRYKRDLYYVRLTGLVKVISYVRLLLQFCEHSRWFGLIMYT